VERARARGKGYRVPNCTQGLSGQSLVTSLHGWSRGLLGVDLHARMPWGESRSTLKVSHPGVVTTRSHAFPALMGEAFWLRRLIGGA
jgi:hypothetical protein